MQKPSEAPCSPPFSSIGTFRPSLAHNARDLTDCSEGCMSSPASLRHIPWPIAIRISAIPAFSPGRSRFTCRGSRAVRVSLAVRMSSTLLPAPPWPVSRALTGLRSRSILSESSNDAPDSLAM